MQAYAICFPWARAAPAEQSGIGEAHFVAYHGEVRRGTTSPLVNRSLDPHEIAALPAGQVLPVTQESLHLAVNWRRRDARLLKPHDCVLVNRSHWLASPFHTRYVAAATTTEIVFDLEVQPGDFGLDEEVCRIRATRDWYAVAESFPQLAPDQSQVPEYVELLYPVTYPASIAPDLSEWEHVVVPTQRPDTSCSPNWSDSVSMELLERYGILKTRPAIYFAREFGDWLFSEIDQRYFPYLFRVAIQPALG